MSEIKIKAEATVSAPVIVPRTNNLDKSNCKFLQIISVSKETGEERISAFITHPDISGEVRLLMKDDDENGDFEFILAHLIANPDWRSKVVLRDNAFGGKFAVLSNSVVKEFLV